MVKYDFEDGKYQVVRNDNYDIEVYRNDERWHVMEDQMKHCKFFHAMLNEIDKLHEQFGGKQ